MRTLWITNDLPPRAGGIEQFVHNLLLRTEPQDALVLGPAHPEAADHDAAVPYAVRRLDGAVLPRRSVLRAVVQAAAEHRPEVVVLGASWPLGELTRRLHERTGLPVVGISHGLEAGLATVGLGPLVGRTTRELAALTTISAYTERRLTPHVHCPVHRVPPGVDVHAFHPEVDGHRMRARWGIPSDATVVGCVSRLVHRKGQDALLTVWPELADRHPDAWLVLAGAGPLEDRLRRRASRMPRVVLPGLVPWDDLPAAHGAFDVFAMPCRTRLLGTDVEGLGIVYLEAQACGVPVVAGDSGGAPETVRDGETGVVVDGTDPGALAAALDRLLADPQLRSRMGAAGRRHVTGSWSWDAIARRWHRTLEEAVSAGR